MTSELIQLSSHDRALASCGCRRSRWATARRRATCGWPIPTTAQPPTRKIIRQGRSCAATVMKMPPTVRNKKSAELSASSLKFVTGTSKATTWSCPRLKSSMQFCRSRIFLKKSLLSSLTGFTVGAGAKGGPWGEYPTFCSLDSVPFGGAGCRAMKAGMNTPSSRMAMGSTKRRYGSKQTKL